MAKDRNKYDKIDLSNKQRQYLKDIRKEYPKKLIMIIDTVLVHDHYYPHDIEYLNTLHQKFPLEKYK